MSRCVIRRTEQNVKYKIHSVGIWVFHIQFFNLCICLKCVHNRIWEGGVEGSCYSFKIASPFIQTQSQSSCKVCRTWPPVQLPTPCPHSHQLWMVSFSTVLKGSQPLISSPSSLLPLPETHPPSYGLRASVVLFLLPRTLFPAISQDRIPDCFRSLPQRHLLTTLCKTFLPSLYPLACFR